MYARTIKEKDVSALKNGNKLLLLLRYHTRSRL
jgi:hypothetical protein